MDTGPWVALIDKSEKAHVSCVKWFQSFCGKLYSTEPVLTEVLYLLNFSIKAQKAAIDYVLRDIITLVPSDMKTLNTAKMLMEKYSDLPMDFADASLVCLANDAGITNIFTLDHKDFFIYRTSDNRSLKIYPE